MPVGVQQQMMVLIVDGRALCTGTGPGLTPAIRAGKGWRQRPTTASAMEEEVREVYDALGRQKRPPPGVRPAPLPEVAGPQLRSVTWLPELLRFFRGAGGGARRARRRYHPAPLPTVSPGPRGGGDGGDGSGGAGTAAGRLGGQGGPGAGRRGPCHTGDLALALPCGKDRRRLVHGQGEGHEVEGQERKRRSRRRRRTRTCLYSAAACLTVDTRAASVYGAACRAVRPCFFFLVFFLRPLVSGSYWFGAGVPEEYSYAVYSGRRLPEMFLYSALLGLTVDTDLRQSSVLLRIQRNAWIDSGF